MRIAKSEARRRFSEVIQRAGYRGERVTLTHYGRTLAAIVSKADLQKLEDCEREPNRNGMRSARRRSVR